MKYDSPKLASIILSLLAFFAVICPSAQAAYSVTFAEVGTDVVATGSGSLNLGDLTLGIPGNDLSYVFASFPALVVGPASPTGFERYSGTFAGPANFGSGGQFFADTGTGPLVGVATL
ncbi:MAG TPA: hypothetical protein VJ719_02225, partial [Chthoniobacterales bacterium]|nr:hypothetical protein [Chthoniobacterales bacterium]